MLEASTSAKGYTPQDEMYLWWLADPASPKLVGDLSLVDRGRGVALRYAAEWLNDGLPLSEDLPLEVRAFLPLERDSAVGAVDDARPDRWGERVIRALDKPPRLSLLEYLYFAGDNRFGALGVSLSSDAYAPSAIAALPTLADVSRVHDIVTKIAAGEPIAERERRLITPGRSMGGARPKSLLTLDGAQWVLKFADAYDHDWPLIEHATMRLGRLAGIAMCETRAIPFAPGRSAPRIWRHWNPASMAPSSSCGASSAPSRRVPNEDAQPAADAPGRRTSDAEGRSGRAGAHVAARHRREPLLDRPRCVRRGLRLEDRQPARQQRTAPATPGRLSFASAAQATTKRLRLCAEQA